MVELFNTTVTPALVHTCQVGLHLLVWEHADVVETKWLENVLLHVVIERYASDTHQGQTSPVDVGLRQ